MKTQAQKYFSLVLPALVVLFTIGLLGLSFILIYHDYDVIINLLLEYSHFPENKLQDLKKEYLSIDRFNLLRYALVVLSLLFIGIAYIVIKWKDSIAIHIEIFTRRLFNSINSLWKSFLTTSLFDKVIVSLCFFLISALVIWGTFSSPLIYDEVFSYLYFVNKGFLVTVTYYPGPNNHIFYLLCCNVVDLVCNDPRIIMRLPALLASLISCATLLLYFNKRFSTSFAVILVLLLYSSFSLFYYSFHGRGYAILLLMFIIALISINEFIKKRSDFYLILFSIASVIGCYTIPTFIYSLLSFAVFLSLYVVIKRDKQLLVKIGCAFSIISIVVIILYSPIILISGLGALVNNSWVKPLSWNDFIMNYGIYAKELQNHFWEVTAYGWVISLLVFIGGVFALYKWRKTWWALVSFILLVCPFVFLLFQRIYPFMRVLDYLYLIVVFLLTSFLIYLISTWKGQSRYIIALIVMVGIASFSVIKICKETPFSNKYYNDLELVMKEVLESGVHKAYTKDDTYALFLKFNSQINNGNLDVLSDASGKEEKIIIIPTNEEIGLSQDTNYQLLVENQSVKAYVVGRK